MAINREVRRGTIAQFKDTSDSAVLIPHPVKGVVKNNIDPAHNGEIWVYVSPYGGIDPDNSNNWIPVRQLNPYYGVSSEKDDPYSGSDKTGYGSSVSNAHSYGMSMPPPPIGTEVICVFINGRIDQGYYIGSVPVVGTGATIPVMSASANIVPNESEGTTYGGATRLPAAGVNLANKALRESGTIYNEPRPVHSYQAAILSKQGLIRDNDRGTIGSNAQRSAVGGVFGFSTPGRSVYEGGFNDTTIVGALSSEDKSKLKKIGSLGGHTFVMDDGTIDGQDQLVRLRTASGHQITMSDSGQTLFIIHSNGQSWIELGKEGTIDIYSANSFNVRTQGDLNLHADRDVNIHANRNLNLYGESVKIDSDKSTAVHSGQHFQVQSFGKYSVKSGATISMESKGNSNYKSGGINYVRGDKVHLNTGDGPAADEVPKASVKKHEDSVYSQKVGWMQPSAKPIVSIVTRAPTHQPWAAAGKGVDVEIDQSDTAASKPLPTEQVQQANDSAPAAPSAVATAEATSTVPGTSNVSVSGNKLLGAQDVKAVVAQQSAIASTLDAAAKVEKGIIPGAAGATLSQISDAGLLKPGAGQFIQDKMAAGKSFTEAAGSTLMSGIEGAKTAQNLVANTEAQVKAVTSSLTTAASSLVSAGLLSGKEEGTQVAGVVMAASALGSKAVTSLLSGSANPLAGANAQLDKLSDMKNMISGGNLAAGVSDKLLSGAKGLATSLSDKVPAPLGIAGITAKLQSIGKQAFDQVESSFGTLKAGVPNPLGGLPAAKELSEVETKIAQMESATEEIFDAEKNLREARKLAREQGPQAAAEQLKAAEDMVAKAKQKTAKLSSDVLSGAENAAKKATSIIPSGLSTLAGGLGAFSAQVSGGVGNALGSLKAAATTISSILGKK